MIRLDHYLVSHKNISTRNRAQLLIKDGAVFVNGKVITKSNYSVKDHDVITLTDSIKYVSRAGLKLEHALNVFSINPLGLKCLDIGSSTGGFTQCLIEHGAKSVTAVDVGTEQLHPTLRTNQKIVLHEQQDIRTFISQHTYDLIVCDASFISLTKVIPEIPRFAKNNTIIVLLIKPQFEVGKDFIGKGGIVTDELAIIEAVTGVVTCAQKHNLRINDEVKQCPVRGSDGNQEYLACFTYIKK